MPVVKNSFRASILAKNPNFIADKSNNTIILTDLI